MWWNVEVFVRSGPTRIGSGPNGGGSGDRGDGSGRGSPYNSPWSSRFFSADPSSHDRASYEKLMKRWRMVGVMSMCGVVPCLPSTTRILAGNAGWT